MTVHKDSKKDNFSLITALSGWLVTVLHGYFTAKWFGKHSTSLKAKGYGYLKSPRFLIGVMIYYIGFFGILQQDAILRALREKPNAKRYEIPHGGLWDYSTSAQYLCELTAFFGFWVLSDFGPNGAFIFFISLFNLVPRASSNYAWYANHFGEEFTQLNRSVLVPGVW